MTNAPTPRGRPGRRQPVVRRLPCAARRRPVPRVLLPGTEEPRQRRRLRTAAAPPVPLPPLDPAGAAEPSGPSAAGGAGLWQRDGYGRARARWSILVRRWPAEGGCPVPVETGTSEHPARLRVGIIGPGRAGTALARALARAGHQVTAAAAVSERSKQRARDNFPGARLTEPARGPRGTRTWCCSPCPTTCCPALSRGSRRPARRTRGGWSRTPAARTAPACSTRPRRAGALPLALHPVMTFTGREDDVDRIKGVSFGVTAPDPLRPAAEALVIEMGGEPVFIAEENRAALPRRARLRRQPPGHAGRRGGEPAARGGRGQPGPDARPAARRRPRQRAAVRRRGPDRAGGPRRRRHGGRPRRGDRGGTSPPRCPPTARWPG